MPISKKISGLARRISSGVLTPVVAAAVLIASGSLGPLSTQASAAEAISREAAPAKTPAEPPKPTAEERTVEPAPEKGKPAQKTKGPLTPGKKSDASSGEVVPMVTSGPDVLEAVSVVAGPSSCSSAPVNSGARVYLCGTFYISPGFYDAQGNPLYLSGAVGLGLTDACGNVVVDGTPMWFWGGIHFSGPGYFRWSSASTLRGDTPNHCLGTWTADFTVIQNFPDGQQLTASIRQNVTVLPDAPSYEWPLGQTYGGTAPMHAPQADPVNSFTGAFYDHLPADLSMAAVGGPLSMARSYSSDVERVGAFGRGWSHAYDSGLSVDAASGAVTHHDPSGAVRVFPPEPGGGYKAPPGVREKLLQTATGWELTTPALAQFGFDNAGRLVSVRDRNGQGTDLGYDVNGLLSSVSGSGRALTVSWNGEGSRITAIAGSDGRRVEYTYDTGGNLSSFLNAAGKKTTYAYDASGRLISIQDPNGNYPVRLTYSPVSGRVEKQYDARGGLTAFEWDSATTTATVTDPMGNKSVDKYANGYLVEQVDGAGRSTRYSWNENGTLRRVTNGAGQTTQFAYDQAGNLLQRTSPDTNRDANGNARTERYTYNGTNDLTSTTDFNGNATSYTYDTKGNLTAVTRPAIAAGAGTVTSLSNTYNTNGTLASSTDAGGKTTRYSYSPEGDLTAVTSPGGQISTSFYDGAGRLTSTVGPRGNISGANPDAHRTTLTLSPTGLVTSVRDPLGNTTTSSFDDGGRPVTTTDAKGLTTTMTYTEDNKTAAVQGPDPAVAPTRFTYDANSNVATKTTPGGKTTTYTYTAANQTETVTSTGSGVYRYTYDLAGRLSSQTSPSGKTATFTHSSIGGIARISYSDGTPEISYTYDPNGNRIKMVDGTGTSNYTYNALNLLATATKGTDTWSYAYDNAGALTGRTLPGSPAQQLTYDSDNRLTRVGAGTTTIASYSYDLAAGATTTHLPGGIDNTLFVDNAGQPLRTKVVKGASVVSEDVYQLDPNGNPVRITNKAGSATTHTYDAGNRLTEVCYGTTSCAGAADYIRWSYDGDGNQLEEKRSTGTTAYAYDAAGHLTSRRSPTAATTYSYDADGNLLTDGTSSYAWNAAGQLISAGGTKPTTFTYDGDGRRTTSAVGRTATEFISDPTTGSLLSERSSGKTVRQYSYGTGLVGMVAGQATYSYATDAIGSVRSVFDSSGAQQLSYAYEPYGAIKSTTSSGKSAPANPLQFLGAYNAGNQYLLSNRQYDPAVGRFLSPDPAAAPGTGYAYGNANPMAYVDPLGLDGIDWRSVTNDISTGVAIAAGVIALGCTVAVICLPAAPIAGGISLVAGAVSLATDDTTVNCFSGKGSCAAAVLGAALLPLGGIGKIGKGVYVVAAAKGTYVGQSGNITRRLQQHVRSGKFTAQEAAAAQRIAVPGGKTQREIMEQQEIDARGGVGNLLNLNNPIGPDRFGFMPNQPYRR